ncbi:hypothetical protein B0T10DRAFT_458319 [Thelonectria olida]|uniref:Uncharacterized protein n=1 Tax=Thelonectria olida TaxID=1576542 RepID=A0A9P8W8N9_9HYPO|nr:hypothetical protein B0T10DRAFT_458319 [Thelonectria olida]
MSSTVQYQFLPGPVGEMLRSASIATTATVPLTGTLVVTTGHVGLNLETGEFVTGSIEDEFNAIFNCLDAALKNAGVSKGLGGAHKLLACFLRAEDEATLHAIFRKRYPGHTPTWTSVVVAGIMNPGMNAEVQAEAIAR